MFQKPKGTSDILPVETQKWQRIWEIANSVLKKYNYGEIRTPMFEDLEIYSRSSGETSDIVTKEMYDFFDKGGRHVALRPEGTAGIVRSFIENKLYAPEIIKPVRLSYMGPMFRYERPQSGRLRQFNQIGVECLDASGPTSDIEVLQLALDLLTAFGIKNLTLNINSLGDTQSRKNFTTALKKFLEPVKESLSEDSQVRFEQNPLRILDSKDKTDQELLLKAPKINDFLSDNSKNDFNEVCQRLDQLNINYKIDNQLVRGLDYYNNLIFEVTTEDPVLASQATVLAGGRYDTLIENLGGPSVPSIGFALGVERLLILMDEQEILSEIDVYVVNVDPNNQEVNSYIDKFVHGLRQQNLIVDRDFSGRKVKAQFKNGIKENTKYFATIGQDEVIRNEVNLKNTKNQKQESLKFSKLVGDFAAEVEMLN